MNKTIRFQNVVAWHKKLHESDRRSLKATLKRCKTTAEICLHSEYVNLVQTLEAKPKTELTLLAGVLAHVKPAVELEEEQKLPTIAEQMAKLRQGRVIISPIRFRQLLACKNNDKLLRMLIRIVPRVDYFNITDFAKSIYFWNIHTKKQWAFNYYRNLPAENVANGE